MEAERAEQIVDQLAFITGGDYEVEVTLSLTGGKNVVSVSRGGRVVEMTPAAARKIGEMLRAQDGDDGGFCIAAELAEEGTETETPI